MKKNDKNRFSLINNFPLIIMVVAAVIIVLLVNVYLSFKPYDTIYQNGYMVLSNNMAYNLINNNSINDTLNVGVVPVNNGDAIYKQIDSYYVGEEQKKEIDYGYPIYSSDGLTIHAINDEFTLVNRNFEVLDGYSGLSLNYGFVYNEGEEEPADNVDYLFMKLENSVFINSQVINIQTEENEYNIPVNSPVYFNGKYINYYTFDGENFNYNRISDIEYESLIKIGDVGVTYEDLLLKMNIAKKVDIEEDKENKLEEENESNQSGNNTGNGSGNGSGSGTGNGTGNGTGDGTGNGSGNGDGSSDGGTGDDLYTEIFGEYVEPTVTADSLSVKTYSLTLDVVVNDPSGVITSGPTFEIYTPIGKVYSRKKMMISGKLKMTGLAANTEYKIVGKYTYKDKFGFEITKTVYEKEFKTQGVDDLETIKISSQTGARYSNKIEIKDFTVLNPGIETLNGVKKITIQTWRDDKPDEVEVSNVSTSLLKNILKGEATTIQSYASLQSDTVYNYKILFYDKNNNIFTLDGKSSGKIQTAKIAPSISSSYSYNYEENSISVAIITNNIDDVYIDEYKYKFYKSTGEILEEGILNYKNKEKFEKKFENLVYETEYYLQITGTYDLEDGNGEVKIEKMIPSKTPFCLAYPSSITAWYYSNQMEVTENSIKTNVYVSKKTNILSKSNGFLKIFLEDSNGKIIDEKFYINESNDLEEYKDNVLYYKYNSSTYLIENLYFENLESDTEYTIKVSAGLLNPDNDNGIDFETDKYIVSSPIKTNKQEVYVEVLKKVLYNNQFIFEYKIVDKDNDIGNKTVRIDIYEKDCINNSCANLYKEDNIYGQQLDLSKKNEKGEIVGSIQSDNYYSDNYTIAISSISRNSSRKYIKVVEKNDSDNTADKRYITLTRSINLTAQMKSQTVQETDEKDINTGKSFKITKSEFEIMNVDENLLSNLAFYDCIDFGNECYVIPNSNIEKNDLKKYILTVENKTISSKNKQLYIVIPSENYKNESGKSLNIKDTGDILYSIDYTTNKNVYEIASVDDFLNLYAKRTNSTNKYPEVTSQSKGFEVFGNYVVTNDLDFSNVTFNRPYYLKTLSGVLDFQGHKATLTYDEANPFKHFIYTINGQGTLKNIELDLKFNFSSTYDTINGIICWNYGTIEDVIINMEQKNPIPMLYNGFIYYNRPLKNSIGTLNRFIVYLKSDIYTDGYSSLGVYSNGGVVKNGYISTHPDSLSNGSKTVYVTKYLGLTVWENFKTVKNIYNLVNVKTIDNSKKYFGTLLYSNKLGGVIENTFSVSMTSIINDNRGPNIYNNESNAINNYYVDINKTSNSYNSTKYPYNKKMDEYLLTNTFFMDSLINDEYQFKTSSWYYPTLKLSSFMQFKQKNISLNYGSNSGYIELALATSAEPDMRKKDQKTKDYQTSKIKLYFNNPSFYKITEIKMNNDDGIRASINQGKTEIDSLTGMTVLDVDLTLTTGGVAKSSYNIEEYCYCYSSDCDYNPKTRCIRADKKVDVDIFREVKDYGELVDSINKNENILITETIKVKDWLDKTAEDINEVSTDNGWDYPENRYLQLPRNIKNTNQVLNYEAKIYGVVDEDNKGVDIDFDDVAPISRGYFIPQFSGTLKNIQIKNLSISSTDSNIGFIRTLNNATIENVDISDSVFNYLVDNSNESNTLYFGTLASKSDGLVSISKTSSNNNTIAPGNTNKDIENSYVGGLVGWMSGTNVSNSYVYNINISNVFVDMEIGKLAIGGLSAYTTGGQINNVYTTGNIESNYSNIGGIVGSNVDSHIDNSYSYINIFSTGKGIGGIAGVQTSLSYNYYRDIMFIGNIEGSTNYSYLLSTDVSSNTNVIYNGYLFDINKLNNSKLSTTGNVMTIPFNNSDGNNNKFYNFKIFDQNDAFKIEYSDTENYLPYLKETSFVVQKIKTSAYRDLSEKITITIDYNNSCQNESMDGDETGNNGLCYDKDNGLIGYANKAVISFSDNKYRNHCIYSDELKITAQNQSSSNSIKSCIVSDNGQYIVSVPENGIYKDYYTLTILDQSGVGINQKTYLPFYKEVGTTNDWATISTQENENIFIIADIDFSGSKENAIVNKRINNLVGGNRRIYGIKYSEGNELTNELINECIIDFKDDSEKLKIYKENCLNKIIVDDNEGQRLELTAPLINSITGTMKDISFENFEILPNSEIGTGLILFNNGTLTNSNNKQKLMFNNIKVTGNNNVGIVALNSGKIDNIDIQNIYVSGGENVGGLVAYDNTTDITSHIENINAENIYVEGAYNLGGVHGYSHYTLQDIKIENFYINYSNEKSSQKGYIGGVVGKGECAGNCKSLNGILIVNGNNIGGVQGGRSSKWTLSKTEARNIVIQNALNSYSDNVGGITGNNDAFANCYVENLKLYGASNEQYSGGELGKFNGKNIGGAAGRVASRASQCYVKNSDISGISSVGGIVGLTTYGSEINLNVVSNVNITATSTSNNSSAGGILGQMLSSSSRGTPTFKSNLVSNVTIGGYSNVGGIIGFFENSIASYQVAPFNANIVSGLNLVKINSSPQTSFGGIIGRLYQVPNSSQKLFKNSVYATLNNYDSIGIINKLNTGAGGNGFTIEQNAYNFLQELSKEGFKKVAGLSDFETIFGGIAKDSNENDIKLMDDIQLNDNNKFFLYKSSSDSVVYIKDSVKNYFPMPKISSWKNLDVYIPIYNIVDDKFEFVIEPGTFIEIPLYSDQTNTSFSTRNLMTARRFTSSSAQSSIKEALDFDVYTVDVNKINIDFSGIDTDSKFYYEIGDYSSPTISVVNRTFTITYDFKEPIKITLDSGGKLITKTIKPKDLIRTISYVNGKVYYIENGLLYSEDKAITGNFIHLYGNKVLTNSGNVYNISTKEENNSNVDYTIQYDTQPLYSFEYNGGLIETYYNYSIYNSIIKDYQIILKNGLINVIDNTIDNKKDSYIIDLYNNNEVQIVLKNDGMLYSLKGNIKYPSDFDNKNIKDLYTDFDSTNNIAVIKYESGEVYAFNYLSGKKVFTNFSTENVGFFDYISNKLKNNTNNSIISLVSMEEYTEINLLKGKLSDISINEATNQLNNNNSSIPENKSDYISVYNDITQKYDIYKTENLLNSIELDPETEKINRNYELIQFYETLNAKEKRKSLSGMIVFTLSIIAILLALYKLIRRRKVRS